MMGFETGTSASDMRPLLVWLLGAIVLAGSLCAIGHLPVLVPIFQLQFWPALVGLAVVYGAWGGASTLLRRGRLGPRARAVVELLMSGVVQIYAAALVGLCRMPGASVFAALFVVVAAHQAHLRRVTIRAPAGLAMTAIAAGLGIAIGPGPEQLALFAVAGPAALAASLLAGTAARLADRRRAENEGLRAALQAQILEEQSTRLDELTHAIVDLLGFHHDVNGPLMAAQIQAESLLELTRGGTLSLEEATAIAHDLQAALGRIPSLLSEARSRGQGRIANRVERVVISPVLLASAGATGNRFSEVELRARCDERLAAAVVGGPLALQRIVDNVLVNACEGDGRRGARHVDVEVVEADGAAAILIIVVDDGPGFQEEQLAHPIAGFSTTKATGTGLGLYTAERLARASGGAITRENGGGGGARVVVRLPTSLEDGASGDEARATAPRR